MKCVIGIPLRPEMLMAAGPYLRNAAEDAVQMQAETLGEIVLGDVDLAYCGPVNAIPDEYAWLTNGAPQFFVIAVYVAEISDTR
ncbi:hypothetical protein SEA_ROMAT_7 [Mycobacterium phage RomaT]|nr:hypothetical protein SEA_ROMAT_7 [Mycobacterium phage RomaT]